MMIHRPLIAALLTIFTLPLAIPRATAEQPTISRIAFGSCVRQDRPQPIWDSIVAESPELFVFLGDNIYGDTEDMDVLRAKYQQLADNPGFQQLRSTCPLLATWDDHDYGANEINRYRVGLTYFETNFGMILVDWDQPSPIVRMQVRDAAGDVVLQHRLPLSELN